MSSCERELNKRGDGADSNKCCSCYQEIDDIDKYHSDSIDGTKYNYCKRCGEERKALLEKILVSRWAKDFPQYVKCASYYSLKGARDTLAESIKYELEQNKDNQKPSK